MNNTWFILSLNKNFTEKCKSHSLKLLELFYNINIDSQVNVTFDYYVIISCRIDNYKSKWQIDSDGDIAAMLHHPNDTTSFHDIPFSEIQGFIKELSHGVELQASKD